MPDCIDLKERFGKRYRVVPEEGSTKHNQDPWCWIIPCRLGPKGWKSNIYPYGGEYLAVMVTGMKVASSMRNWPELTLIQDASDAVCFKFHVDHLDKVAKRVGAIRRRRLSPERRKKLTEAGTLALKNWRKQTLRGHSALTTQRKAPEATQALFNSSKSEI